MRAQILKTDAVDGVKKDRKAHRGTPSLEQNKACILLLMCIIRNFDQNVCPVRGTYYANKCTYMEKIPYKSPPPPKDRRQGLRIFLKTSVWGGGRCRADMKIW